jgi:hypothetical protein
MEPAEKFSHRIVKLVLTIIILIVSIGFAESSYGKGMFPVVIFVIGAAIGALGLHLLKSIRK